MKNFAFYFSRRDVAKFDSSWGWKPFRNFSQNYNYLS